MNICNNCGNQIDGLPFKCKYCGLNYCLECRLPEYHNCFGLKIHKKQLQNEFIRNASSIANDHYVVNDWGFNQIEDKKRSISKKNRPPPSVNKKYKYEYAGGYKKRGSSSSNTYKFKSPSLFKKMSRYIYRKKKMLFFVMLLVFGFIVFDNIAVNDPSYYLDEFTTIEKKVSEFVFEEPISNKTKNVEKSILKYTNTQRTENGLNVLTWDDNLASIAREHSLDMATNSFFDHTNLKGEDPTDRAIRNHYIVEKKLGGGYYSVGIGENIGSMPTGNVEGMGYVYSDADSIGKAHVDSWMDSQGHRENILNPEYDVIGVGVAYGGVYYVATQNFK